MVALRLVRGRGKATLPNDPCRNLDVKKYEFHDIHNYWESPNCYRITRVQKVRLHIFARRIERLKQENPAEAGFSLAQRIGPAERETAVDLRAADASAHDLKFSAA